MAKYFLECPKCGSINTPPNTLKFWQKEITCVTCGESFNIKQTRMISKECPNCHKVIICDQKKLQSKRCPFCGESMANSATAEYKLINVICPQCSCQIEADKTKDTAECPICGEKINIAEYTAKEKQVSDNGISVIKYEGDNETFIWKHPIEDFNFGSRLIVHESQEAVFFMNGQALDSFGAGEYTLETENLPVLKKIYRVPGDGKNSFHAEIYFINKTVQMAIKWGTDSRVRFIEPETGIPLDIGASGELNLQVQDARKLLITIVGTTKGIAWEKDSNGFTKSLKDTFKPLIMTTVKTNLAAAIKNEHINILEVDEKLELLSESLRTKISEGFEEYGLTVPQFYVTNISLPEKDEKFKELKNLMGAAYLGVRKADIDAEIEAANRKAVLEEQATKIEKAKFEAEKKRIEAQAEADAMTVKGKAGIDLKKQSGFAETEIMREKGLAEAEIMREKGYSQKDVLQAEVQEAYAAGSGSSGGGMMSDIIGLGVGMAAMGSMGEKVGNVMKNFNRTETSENYKDEKQSSLSGWKCSCGCDGNSGKFCSECGKAKPEPWDCPKCGEKDNRGKFCSGCGCPKPELWVCPHCGASGNKGKFCSECGKAMESSNTWDCECGEKNITSKFCPECGNKREGTNK